MKNFTRIFISYCHDNINKGELLAILNWMKTLADNIEIFFDLKLDGGDNLKQFMNKISDVDGILILGTPEYKKKAESRNENSGVYTEYNAIKNRLNMLEELKQTSLDSYYEKNVYICPAIYTETYDKSIPCDFSETLAIDLTRLRALKKTDKKTDEYFIPEKTKLDFEKSLKKFISNSIAIHSMRTPYYKENTEIIFKKLLRATRHEYFPIDNSLVVKTAVYNSINSQNSLFMIGRKGSGKTTIATTLHNMNPNIYKGTVPILADNFDLNLIYNKVYTKSIWSDINKIFSLQDILEYIWDIFIYTYSSFLIYKEGINGKLRNEQYAFFSSISDYFNNLFSKVNNHDRENNKVISLILYNLCFEKFFSYLETEFIDKINLDTIDVDIPAIITKNQIRDYVFSSEFTESVSAIAALCSRHIIVTLDGFDDKFERFREETIKYNGTPEYSRRIEFEVSWLCSLIEYVICTKNENNQDPLLNLLDFCIALPHDRFFEIRKHFRNFHKYRNSIISTNWSGPELVIMLRKRLEAMYQISSNGESYYEKLHDVIKRKAPQIPENIELYINEKPFTLPLFQYVLRLSFWRPRDILTYYGNIFSSFMGPSNSMNRNKDLSADMIKEMIKRIIKETSLKIIEDEFIGEYRHVFYNINEVISAFDKKNHLLEESELVDIIKDVKFDIITDESLEDVKDKIRYLYEIGFLGVEVSDEYKKIHSITNRHVFIFTEGILGLRGLKKDAMLGSKFVIHPAFYEKLHSIMNSEYLLCNYPWTYMRALEILTSTNILDYYTNYEE